MCKYFPRRKFYVNELPHSGLQKYGHPLAISKLAVISSYSITGLDRYLGVQEFLAPRISR
jgi:hypothetical protein